MVPSVQGGHLLLVQKSTEDVIPTSERAREPHQNTAEAWREQGPRRAHIKDFQIGIGFPGLPDVTIIKLLLTLFQKVK